jgi:hypothetical protein
MLATVITLTSLFACGQKTPASTTAAAAPASSQLTMVIPDGGKAKAFAMTIIGAPTQNFSPSDNDGATFEYTKLSFRGDGTWMAEGYVEAMDERMECVESGAWTLEDVESASTALISWTVKDTDCVGRDKGTETRAKVTVSKSGIESAQFR